MRNIVTLFRKELAAFFNSLIAYIVIIVFLTGVGLFFWVFGDSVLVTGMASMDNLFAFAPWFFLFLVPAITMRSFAEEIRSGTIEMLATKPVTDWEIILGKYFAACFLIVFSLVPTFVYYLTLADLGTTSWNLDNGPIIGAYLGLIALGCVFSSVGILASALTENQIVSFIVALFLSFFFYSGFDFLAELDSLAGVNTLLLRLGMNEHYRSISKGVVDTRDVIYFVSFILICLFLTRFSLALKKK